MLTKKNVVPFILSLFLLFFGRIIPGGALSADAMHMLGIFAGAVVLWLFVGIDWPSVLVLIALCLLPQAGTNAVVAASFGNSTVSFLLFSFILTYALETTGFLRRCALWFISGSVAKKSPWHFLFLFLTAVMCIGSFIAPTLTFLLFYALINQLTAMLQLKKGSALGTAMMAGTAIVTSIACGMTPIAHTFPLMALGYYEAEYGASISFIEYLKIGLPAGLVLFAATFMVLRIALRRSFAAEKVDLGLLKLPKQGAVGREEGFALTVFVFVVLAWLLTGLFPKQLASIAKYGTTMPAMLGVVVLCAVPIRSKAVLSIKEGITKGVSWPSILICAAALAIGKFVTAEELGITAAIGNALTPILGSMNVPGALMVIIAVTVIMTNFMSNIVTTTAMYSIVSGVLVVINVGSMVIDPKLTTILIGMCASFAYATPPAIAHIAIAAASDWATPRDMLKYGGIVAIVTILVTWLSALPFA